jgi:hypothetical protein
MMMSFFCSCRNKNQPKDIYPKGTSHHTRLFRGPSINAHVTPLAPGPAGCAWAPSARPPLSRFTPRCGPGRPQTSITVPVMTSSRVGQQNVCIVVYYCSTIQSCAGGRRIVEDMCYEIRLCVCVYYCVFIVPITCVCLLLQYPLQSCSLLCIL